MGDLKKHVMTTGSKGKRCGIWYRRTIQDGKPATAFYIKSSVNRHGWQYILTVPNKQISTTKTRNQLINKCKGK